MHNIEKLPKRDFTVYKRMAKIDKHNDLVINNAI